MELNKIKIPIDSKDRGIFNPTTGNDGRGRAEGHSTQLKEIKIHRALTCNLNETVQEIAKKLKENKDRRIFVVDEKNNLKGIITTTDLVYKCLAGKNENLRAKNIMTKDIKSVDISEDLEKALGIMNEIKSFSCPLTEKGKIIGMLSYHDILGHVFKSLGE